MAFSLAQGFVAGGRGAIQAANAASDLTARGAKQTFLFQSVEQGIQGAQGQTIAVPRQFLDHAKTENRFIARMVENMQADQAGIEVARLLECSHSGNDPVL